MSEEKVEAPAEEAPETEETEPEAEAEATEKEAPPENGKVKVKVGEKEYELDEERLTGRFKVKLDKEEGEVDLEELRRGYQRSKVAQKRFDEAALLRKEASALGKRVVDDPVAAAIE